MPPFRTLPHILAFSLPPRCSLPPSRPLSLSCCSRPPRSHHYSAEVPAQSVRRAYFLPPSPAPHRGYGHPAPPTDAGSLVWLPGCRWCRYHHLRQTRKRLGYRLFRDRNSRSKMCSGTSLTLVVNSRIVANVLCCIPNIRFLTIHYPKRPLTRARRRLDQDHGCSERLRMGVEQSWTTLHTGDYDIREGNARHDRHGRSIPRYKQKGGVPYILLPPLSLSIHAITNNWMLFPHTSRYMLRFITLAVYQNGIAISHTWQFFLALLNYTTICPTMPRFIISVRELYDHDLRSRRQGIDTGFGVLSQPIASQNTAVSAISFAEAATGQGQGQGGDAEVEIRPEELGDGAHQVADCGHADKAEVTRLEVLGDASTHQV
ncbi:hypothetical protein HD554DRAFT_923566 [Boletus coccyginus]|nr:hypothetical protein HD554DRAFT_923566 [Boletus coccyginus]